MKYLMLVTDDHRILYISDTLGYQENGNYLIMGGAVAIPQACCIMREVDAVPDGVEPEKWRYIDGEFVLNPSWRDPDLSEVDEILNTIEGGFLQ